MNTSAPVFNTNMFFWHKDLNLLTVDHSQLSHEAPQVFAKLDEPNDHGFWLESHRTHRMAEFRVDYVDTTGGEIQGWNLKPTPETVRRNPALAGIKVLVVNT